MSTIVTVSKGFFRVLGTAWSIITQFLGTLVLLLGVGIVVVLVIVGKKETHANPPNVTQKVITAGSSEKKIVVLPLNGEIVSSAQESTGFSLSTNTIAADQLIPILRQLTADDSVKAVILHVNSPGGAVVATDEIYRAALALKAKKPIVAVFRDVTASGGYYFSMASNKIVANPATLTGSIGVITQSTELSGLYSKLGVSVRTFKSGEFKDIGSPARKMTPAEEDIIQAIITDSYDQFVQAVSLGRNWDEQRTRAIADGRVVSGKEALKLGLIDELGGLDRGIEIAKELSNVSDGEVVEYQLGGWWGSLFSSRLQQSPVAGLLFGSAAPFAHSPGLYYLWQ